MTFKQYRAECRRLIQMGRHFRTIYRTAVNTGWDRAAARDFATIAAKQMYEGGLTTR